LKKDRIKIADLGEAKDLDKSIVRTFAGTRLYMSPEMVLFEDNSKKNISVKTDVWSLGIVIYELITLRRPFTWNEILDADIPELESEDCSEDVPILFNYLIDT